MIIRIIPVIVQGSIRKIVSPEIIPDFYLSTEDLTLYIDFLCFRIEFIWVGFI